MIFSKPARRAWTAAERQTLDKLLERGKTAPEIAAVLQRTQTCIYSQLQRLSIKTAGRLLVRFGLKAKK